MRRWLPVALGAALLAVAMTAAPAGGATKPISISSLAKRLDDALIYVSPGLRKEVDQAALQKVATSHDGYRVIVLNRLPRGTETAEAAAVAVLGKVPKKASPPVTFVAVAHVTDKGTDLGGAQAGEAVNAELVREAADFAEKAGKASVVETMQVFVDQVASGKLPGEEADGGDGGGDDGGGRSWLLYALVLLVAGGGLLAALRMRAVSRERRRRARVGSIGTARSFHTARLDGLALRHSELVRAVAERADDPALAEHHQTAGAKLVALRRQLPGLFSPRELRTCAGELDEVEFHVESAEALAEGRALPMRPGGALPALCFFTHEHGLGTVEVDVTRNDGTVVPIRVCPANAVALARGEDPLVSTVHVGGRQVPWPAAPTYYGAAGWTAEDLPGLEYEGREIWGRVAPRRDEPVDVPEGAVPGIPPEAVLPPGVSTPLPPGVAAPAPLIDDAALPPGVATPPPLLDEAALPPAAMTPNGAPGPSTPAAPAGEPTFEELEEPPPAVIAQQLEDEVTAEHAPVDADATQAYDPFADDDAPPWEREDPAPR